MSRPRGRRTPATWLGVAAVLALTVLLGWQGLGRSELPGSSDTSEQPAAATAGDLPVVALADLPSEAAATLDLIEEGGPFPHEQDGDTFFNREELLPERPEGYYREYTVATPGSDDRGARRIVAGDGGELYWTDDHYASFSVIEKEQR